jgi:hypothetical protein
VYAALVDQQADEERQRKAGLEARGLALITTSAALVSLLFGLAAVVTDSDSFQLTEASKIFLIASTGFFVFAAVLGLGSNWPFRYQQVDIANLRDLTSEEYWSGDETVASRRVAQVRVSILARARKMNLRKGRLLLAGILVEVLAVLSLAVSVIVMVAGA